jgi:hypothetical protein
MLPSIVLFKEKTEETLGLRLKINLKEKKKKTKGVMEINHFS